MGELWTNAASLRAERLAESGLVWQVGISKRTAAALHRHHPKARQRLPFCAPEGTLSPVAQLVLRTEFRVAGDDAVHFLEG
jgi:hypothetical protein